MYNQAQPWFKQRRYIHFDLPISVQQAESIVTSPDKVKAHSFYPFISYTIKSKKVRKDKNDSSISINEKMRLVSYASHVDSHIYTYYAYTLNQAYENLIKSADIENNVLAFRKLGKSNIDFANTAFDEIIKRKYCTAIALDIEGFFDNLDHTILKHSWCRVLDCEMLPDDHYKIFKSMTKFAYVEKELLYNTFDISINRKSNKQKRICKPAQFRQIVRNNGLINVNNKQKGIPQGSPLSALLSNIYMIEFDTRVKNIMKGINACYFRYCDDILCILPHARKDEVLEVFSEEIKRIKLVINATKTTTSDYRTVNGQLTCDKPMQYLGFTFDGQNKLIRSAAFARFSERMKKGVRLAKLTKIKHNRIRIRKGVQPQEVYKQKIYERYSHLGKRNFIRYGYRSARVMKSNAIKKQLKPLWLRLQKEILK